MDEEEEVQKTQEAKKVPGMREVRRLRLEARRAGGRLSSQTFQRDSSALSRQFSSQKSR